jgi:hypothetical protein
VIERLLFPQPRGETQEDLQYGASLASSLLAGKFAGDWLSRLLPSQKDKAEAQLAELQAEALRRDLYGNQTLLDKLRENPTKATLLASLFASKALPKR